MIIYCRDDVVESLVNRPKGKEGSVSRKESELQHKKLNIVNKLDEEKFALAKKQEKSIKK